MEAVSLSDRAYYMLKEMIPNMDKGQHLSMRDLANQMGMSYTPVREAFHRLKSEGFTGAFPKRRVLRSSDGYYRTSCRSFRSVSA